MSSAELEIYDSGSVLPWRETIEAKKITLVYKSPSHPMSVRGVGFLRITPETSVYHGERVEKLHPRTPHFVMLATQQEGSEEWDRIETTWRNREFCPFELNHIIGRIDLTLKFRDLGVNRIQWVHPEAGLHPVWCCGLGDVLIEMSGAGGGK